MEIERRQLNVFDLQPGVTRQKLYTPVVVINVSLSVQKNRLILSAPLSQVLLFVLSLAHRGLSLGTVKGYFQPF